MDIKILFFAQLRDLIGQDHDTFAIISEKITATVLLHAIGKRYPHTLSVCTSSRIAVDHEFVLPHEPLRLTATSEIAVIPPVSGG